MNFVKAKRDKLDVPGSVEVMIEVHGEESAGFKIKADSAGVQFTGMLTPPNDPAKHLQFVKDFSSLMGLAFDEHTKLRKNLLSKLSQ